MARTETSSRDLNSWDVNLQASNRETFFQFTGSTNFVYSSRPIKATMVKMSQRFKGMQGYWQLSPRYNFEGRKPAVTVSYSVSDTSVTVDAERERQKVTVSQRVTPRDIFTPSVTTNGRVEFEYRRLLPQGSLGAAFRPDDSVELDWKDGQFQASIKAPMQGYYTFREGVKINIRRSVEVM